MLLNRLKQIRFRDLLPVFVYPWGLWRLSKWPGRYVARRFAHWRFARVLKFTSHTMTYALVGLPMTVATSGELLITLNETFVAEQANYRLQSDFENNPNAVLTLPGTKTPEIVPPEPNGDPEKFRRYLTEKYAPVFIQKFAEHPEWDLPVAIDYDGNEDPRDNVVGEPQFRPHRAVVYGEVTAETDDSYFLTYSLYHVKDYDHPVREMISSWTYHDSDNEGLHLRVDKQTMSVAEVEAWFHNRFLLCNNTGASSGTEPVNGKIQFEGEHVIVYAQSQGHGVRCAQSVDQNDIAYKTKIFRFRGSRPLRPTPADHEPDYEATYDLHNFDRWYAWALGPFGKEGKGEGMFEERIKISDNLDGKPAYIGYYIAGIDYAKSGWSRPKPPWSWDDGWDEIPIFTWHFFPAEAFMSHSGSELSDDYLYNRPCEKTFGKTPEQLRPLLSLKVTKRNSSKWKNFKKNETITTHQDYWRLGRLKAKEYVNYLFRALG